MIEINTCIVIIAIIGINIIEIKRCLRISTKVGKRENFTSKFKILVCV